MRRLLTWITILMACASLPLVGIRAIHSDSPSTACIQLISPSTGDILTLDTTTGTALLDPRAEVPSMPQSAYASVSPDQTHIIDTWSSQSALLLGRRSTTYRRILTTNNSYSRPVWSPDSRYVAFGEITDYANYTLRVNLAIVEVSSSIVKREPMLEKLDSSNFGYQDLIWSPDSNILAAAMYNSTADGTLALRAAQADQSIFVSLSNRRVDHMMWSPNSQSIIVFAAVPNSSTQRTIYFISRDGQILNQLVNAPYEPTVWFSGDSSAPSYKWSPDGNYFYIADSAFGGTHIDIFRFDGVRMLTEPLLILDLPLAWAKLPHTLLFIVGDGEPPQFLYELDAETGKSQLLLDHFITYPRPTSASDSTYMVNTAPDDWPYTVPYVISPDLSQVIAPFGKITSQINVDFRWEWSPDSRRLLITSVQDSTPTLSLWDRNTGEVHQFKFAKARSGVESLPIAIQWLTNDLITLNVRSLWRIESGSNSLVKLISLTGLDYIPDDYNPFQLHADEYISVATLTSYGLYHASDGSPLFTNLPRGDGKIAPFIEPKERAVLLSHSAVVEITNSNYRQLTEASLDLITDRTNVELANTDNLTTPAWSPDGESFAFGVIEPPNARWTVKVMSRDGTLLRSFILSPRTANTPYRQIRWTNCQ